MLIFEKDYTDNIKFLERFEDKVCNEIIHLLNQNNIILAIPVQSRIKKWESLSQKILLQSLIIDSIFDIQDIVGIRLITNFYREMESVTEIVEKNFEIIKKYNTSDRLGENKFGYASIHYIIKIPQAWNAVPSLSELDRIMCEIQVRTLAQHLWASTSHMLQYKMEESIPLKLRREINRISALLELIDEEYERILKKREELLNAEIKETDNINVDNLQVIFEKKLPIENKSDDEDYSSIVSDLIMFNIKSIAELSNFINAHLDSALKADKKRVLKIKSYNENDKMYKLFYKRERQEKGVFYTHIGLIREMLFLEFGKKWQDYNNNKYILKENNK